jgi:4-hydroxy-tetrahydrodipicolinate reductase
MAKIALIGYGKMGHEIEKIARERGNEIVLIIDVNNSADLNVDNLKKADVAIDFSTPDGAFGNIMKCFDANTPIVCGTTGWLDKMPEVKGRCLSENQTFFYASNFSLGVNLFFKLNEHLAKLMNPFPVYDVKMTEVHHIHKLDAPSGTAITLAEGIIDKLDRKDKWLLDPANADNAITIKAVREGEVPGIHTVTYQSDVDFIEITHSANSRKGLALGAVLAAEFVVGKKGYLGMNDLLSIPC